LTGSVWYDGRVPPPAAERDPRVWLRGCRFNADAPLTFDSLRKEAQGNNPAVGILPYRKKNDEDTSFRVVIEPIRAEMGK
jgi:hypothetical protein